MKRIRHLMVRPMSAKPSSPTTESSTLTLSPAVAYGNVLSTSVQPSFHPSSRSQILASPLPLC
uniref:Uncharacterized protein n=1 Tax=Utricularia reniformis TaxID=192314 RepID=A0A1Y0B044_9LAMI|nr:hypothetical protein AEK19_MT0539 [Utricularia reniformis]ART30795.1 hypothetical protein AEK19_MT0539 [Utricularia reniformis]